MEKVAVARTAMVVLVVYMKTVMMQTSSINTIPARNNHSLHSVNSKISFIWTSIISRSFLNQIKAWQTKEMPNEFLHQIKSKTQKV